MHRFGASGRVESWQHWSWEHQLVCYPCDFIVAGSNRERKATQTRGIRNQKKPEKNMLAWNETKKIPKMDGTNTSFHRTPLSACGGMFVNLLGTLGFGCIFTVRGCCMDKFGPVRRVAHRFAAGAPGSKRRSPEFLTWLPSHPFCMEPDVRDLVPLKGTWSSTPKTSGSMLLWRVTPEAQRAIRFQGTLFWVVSSRGVRIRVPSFRWSILVGNSSQKKHREKGKKK